jgi:hypothetical protein
MFLHFSLLPVARPGVPLTLVRRTRKLGDVAVWNPYFQASSPRGSPEPLVRESSLALRAKRSWPARAGNAVNVPQLLDVAREIDEIATLKPGWDGHDAPVLSGLVASRAFLLLLSLEDATGGAVPLPATVAPIADGGLQLEWDRDRLQIEVQVAPDGTYGYLLIHDPFGSERYEEADDLTLAAMIQVLLDAFRR